MRSTGVGRLSEVDWGDKLARYAAVLVKWAGLAFLVCLAYFVYVIYGGQLSGADAGRAYGLVQSFGTGLVVSSFLLALGLVVLTLHELAYAVVVGIGGMALMLGVPYMVSGSLSQATSPGLQSVVELLSRSGTNAGIAVLVVVGLRVLYEIYDQVSDAPARRQARLEREAAEDAGILKKQKTVRVATAFSRCWELPFCHDRIREICPAYKARKACWRYGMGCNCDPKLIESLIRMGAPGKGPKSEEMKRREGAYIRSDLEADVAKTSKAERTIPCRKCPIFNEHQRLKFKLVNPVAIVATLVVMGVLLQPITQAWSSLAQGIARVASQISLGGTDPGKWFEYLDTPVVRYFFLVILTLFVLSYVLKFTEWAVLEKKIL